MDHLDHGQRQSFVVAFVTILICHLLGLVSNAS